MEIPDVTALPELNQDDFPALPEVPPGRVLLCIDTEWKNTEKEFAAGCIVNACLLAKKWHPVPTEHFLERLKANPMIPPFLIRGVVNALEVLVNDGFIKAVNYHGATYFIPTPRLANVALADDHTLRLV